VTTALIVAVLLAKLGALRRVARGLAIATAACGGLAVLAFGLPSLVLGSFAAAATGFLVYVVVLAVWRPAGLRDAWAYMRALQ